MPALVVHNLCHETGMALHMGLHLCSTDRQWVCHSRSPLQPLKLQKSDNYSQSFTVLVYGVGKTAVEIELAALLLAGALGVRPVGNVSA